MITLYDNKCSAEHEYPNDSRFRVVPVEKGVLGIMFGPMSDESVCRIDMEGLPVTKEHLMEAVDRLNKSLESWLSSSDNAVFIIPEDVLRNVNWEQVFSDLGKEHVVGHGKELDNTAVLPA